uniref:Uncharacterized protein n=1 Tax=Anguilla anguilla TaxID=7936 RepID=A0A0E9VL87_ANGAN
MTLEEKVFGDVMVFQQTAVKAHKRAVEHPWH